MAGEDVCSGNVFDDEEEFMDEMLSLLMEDVAGTFILCSHPAAAKRIAAFIFENSPRTDIAFFNAVNCDNGYNTLLIGADIETVNLGACRNILLCDAVGSHTVNALAERAPHAEILLLQNDMQALLSALPKGYADISRETFAEIYKAVRAPLLKRRDLFGYGSFGGRTVQGADDIEPSAASCGDSGVCAVRIH